MTTHPPKTPDELAAALERARAKEAEKAAARPRRLLVSWMIKTCSNDGMVFPDEAPD